MFAIIQRCCFHTPFRLQKLAGPRLLLCGKDKTTWSPLGLQQLQRDVCLLSRTSRLKPAVIYATKLQAFHTSLPFFKKKTPAVSEAESQKKPGSLKDSPKPALYLSLAGLFPFVYVPVVMAIKGTYYPELAFAQVTYGAVTASLLGGMRWGFALPENSPAKPDWLNLANSIVPPLFAWQALLLKDITQGAVMIVMALGIALHYDVSLLPTYPRWFKVLRVIGTVVMAASLLATAFLRAVLE
ncbi:PREDICTED: transmembrane protein 69 [Acanthisitta chloris]|nr:PREDICTED: transmembrane protein 69 [Acanthisitta chloris]